MLRIMRPHFARPLLPSLVLLLAGLFALFAVACSTNTETSDATATRSPGGETGEIAQRQQPATEAPAERRKLGTTTGQQFAQRAPDFEPLPGATADFGALGGAVYRIEVPEEWNGELILVAHGVRLDSNEVYVSNPPNALRQLWIDEGFAWAASSYSENGYVPGIGADETLELMDYFADTHGQPERVYLYGESMGGHTTALLMEEFPELFDGGLAVCGAIGGEEQIDYLVAWAMAAEYLSGVPLPDGQGQARMAAALMGPLLQALGSPTAPTEIGQQFQSVARELSGGPRPFFQQGFAEHFQLNFGLLLVDPNREGLAAAAATNANIRYDIDEDLGLSAEELNDGVRRLPADPAKRNADAHPDAVPTTGRIEAPLLTLHNTGDVFVPISHQVSYAKKADAAGSADLLVQRAIRAAGHCKFTAEEVTTAWNDLRKWVEDGERADGDDLTGDLSDVGLKFTMPLREGDPGGR